MTEERKPVKKVVKGNTKKKNRFADTFTSDLEEIVRDKVRNNLIPELKLAIIDIAASMMGVENRGRKKSTIANYVSYNRFSDDKPVKSGSVDRNSAGYRYDNVIFDTRADAREVLNGLEDIIGTYDSTSVADFYELSGITPNHTDFNYGWENLRTAEIVQTMNGYIIRMPKAIALKSIRR